MSGITRETAERVAKDLFPDEPALAYPPGFDCRAYYETPGQPCPICADRQAAWERKVDATLAALTAWVSPEPSPLNDPPRR